MATAKKKSAKSASKKTAKTAKTAAAKKTASAGPAIKDRYNKTQILTEIAESTELSKKEVSDVLGALSTLIERHIKPRAVGEFTLPGLMKVKTVRKPAQKARKNVPNPFRPGETMDVAAKPARTVVKVLPLKQLKDMAS